MSMKHLKTWTLVLAATAMVATGCMGGSDNAGPATQSDVNSLTKTLQKNSGKPDVPPENMVPTGGAGPHNAGGVKPGGK